MESTSRSIPVSLNTSINSETEASSVQRMKSQYEEEIQILINKNQFQAAEIDELYDKIQHLQREKLSVQKSAEKSESEKLSHSNELSALRSEVTKYRTRIDEMNEQREEMQRTFSERENGLQQQCTEQQKTIEELQRQLSELTKQKEGLEIKFQQSLQKITISRNKEMEELRKNGKTMKEKVEELEMEKRHLVESFQEKQSEVERLESMVEQLKKKTDTDPVTSDSTDLETQLTSREREIQSLKDIVGELTRENERLQVQSHTKRTHFEKELSQLMLSESDQSIEWENRSKQLLNENLALKLRIDTLSKEILFLKRDHEVKVNSMMEEHQHNIRILQEEFDSKKREDFKQMEQQRTKSEEEKKKVDKQWKKVLTEANKQFLTYLETDSRKLHDLETEVETSIKTSVVAMLNELDLIMQDVLETESVGRSQLEELRREMEGLNTEIRNVKQRNGALMQELNTAQKSEGELQLMVESLNRDLFDVRNKFEDLQTKYMQEKLTLQAELQLANSEKEAQERANAQREHSLKETCESLKLDNDQLHQQIEKLRKMHDEDMRRERMNNKTPLEVTRLREELDKSENRNNQYKLEMEDLRKRIKSFKQQIREKDERNVALLQEQRNMQKRVDEQVKLIEKSIGEQEASFNQKLAQSYQRSERLEEEARIRQGVIRAMEVRNQDLEQQILDLESEQRTDRKKILSLTSKLKAFQHQLLQQSQVGA